MLKVLHVPNYYKPHIGGIEQTCHDIVESLKDQVLQRSFALVKIRKRNIKSLMILML